MIVTLAVLGAGAYGIAYVVTDGFGKDTVYVGYAGKIYTQTTEGLVVMPGAEFIVQKSDDSEAEYTVKIEATSGTDFEFKIGVETFRWKDLAGNDYTDGFKITRTDNGFKLSFEDTLSAILTKVQGESASIASGAYTGGDIFTLIITSGNQVIRLGFGIDVPVEDIQIYPSGVIA